MSGQYPEQKTGVINSINHFFDNDDHNGHMDGLDGGDMDDGGE